MEMNERDADWVSAYLEWTGNDSEEALEADAVEWTVGYQEDTAWSDIDRQHSLLEGILQMALRTESECIDIARRALDDEDAAPALRQAYEALGYAEKLLQDESQAWRLVHKDFTPRWPHALEDIHADVRSLSRRVLELHAH